MSTNLANAASASRTSCVQEDATRQSDYDALLADVDQ
jgi:hypothetical protein